MGRAGVGEYIQNRSYCHEHTKCCNLQVSEIYEVGVISSDAIMGEGKKGIMVVVAD